MNEHPPRLRSLDALRGFDMFWIVGGSAFVAALAEATDLAALHWMADQCHHVEWHGFRFWDLVFPLFLFLAGVSTAFSFAKRLGRGDARGKLAAHVVRRGLTLVLLGAIYNGLLKFDWEEMRWASVLGRIGLGWMFAALLALRFETRGLVVAAILLLLGYWAALAWIPVPGHGPESLSPVLEPGSTLADWIDRKLLPGRLHRGDRDPEGILSTVPAIATALGGVLAGGWLRRSEIQPLHRGLGLLAAGALLLGLGALWNLAFPINKNLWTSSFVVWTAGWSCLALGLFYLAIDVGGLRAIAFPFVVIGANAITIYLARGFVDFDGLAGVVLGAGAERRVHPALLAGAGLALEWLVLWTLYRRKIFLRV